MITPNRCTAWHTCPQCGDEFSFTVVLRGTFEDLPDVCPTCDAELDPWEVQFEANEARINAIGEIADRFRDSFLDRKLFGEGAKP